MLRVELEETPGLKVRSWDREASDAGFRVCGLRLGLNTEASTFRVRKMKTAFAVGKQLPETKNIFSFKLFGHSNWRVANS